MKKKYYILAVLCIALFCLIRYINKDSSINIHQVSTEIVTNATVLATLFVTNEENANDRFKNKILEVKGTILDLNFKNDKTTLILSGYKKEFNIICDMKLNEAIDKNMINEEVVIKGVCKGFLNDVIMLNCMLINIESNE